MLYVLTSKIQEYNSPYVLVGRILKAGQPVQILRGTKSEHSTM